MQKFFSCDWGTSSFRLRLIEMQDASIIAEMNSDKGIANCFELWKRDGRPDDRLNFYLDIIRDHLKKLQVKIQLSLEELPLIISGMASSSMGMVETPYKDLPFSVDGSDLIIKKIEPTASFNHTILIISGVKTGDDVMRGEETQIAGCDIFSTGEQIFVFPGTHSKHVWVKENRVVNFKTYMTGEFFALLSEKSILSEGIEKGNDFEQPSNQKGFKKGVEQALRDNLLHSSFIARTNYLFNKLTRRENYFYLAGLLIGTELKELLGSKGINIHLVSNETLGPLYEKAFQVLKESGNYFMVVSQDADAALIKGQLCIYKNYRN